MLFSCLLLEYKVVLIVSHANGTPLLNENDMAAVFECLLLLIQPIDKHIFTQVPFMYKEEMITLI